MVDQDEDELEATIRNLVARYNAAREGSAEHRFVERQLIGIRRRSELGYLIVQEFEMTAELFLPGVVG